MTEVTNHRQQARPTTVSNGVVCATVCPVSSPVRREGVKRVTNLATTYKRERAARTTALMAGVCPLMALMAFTSPSV